MQFFKKSKTKQLLAILAIFTFTITTISCKPKEVKPQKKKTAKTAPISYKLLWHKKTDLKLSDVYLSSQGQKILAISSEKGKAILLDQEKTYWTKEFPGFEIRRATPNEVGSRVLIFLDKLQEGKKPLKEQEKKLLLLEEDGQIIFEKTFLLSEGFFNVHLSKDGKRMAAFFYPARPDPKRLDPKNLAFFLLLNDSGNELFKQTFEDSPLLSDDVSPDFSRFLVGVVFPPSGKDKEELSQIIGYEEGKEVFRTPSQKGALSARFLPDKDFYAKASLLTKELSLHKWKEDKALWTKKVENISDVQIYGPSDRILARSHRGVYTPQGSSFISEFNLFSKEGKKLWERTEESSAFYDSKVSPDDKKIVLIPLDHPEKPAFLFTNLSKGTLPQKLPKNTSAASFSPDSTELAIATSDGYIKFLKMK